jgi:aminodeoxyfutalosine deaminase
VRFIKAVKIFDGEDFLEPGTVLVCEESGEIHDIISEKALDRGRIESLDGVLLPGFVNAHGHLELSHLRDKLPRGGGLPGFAAGVVKARKGMPAEAIAEAMKAADEEMWRNGIVAAGDICNGDESFGFKTGSKLAYHSFIELIGFHPGKADEAIRHGQGLMELLLRNALRGSLAAHAPYSVSAELMKKIAAFDESLRLPFCIHFRESPDEVNFLTGKQGSFYTLYSDLGIDISWFHGSDAVAGATKALLPRTTPAMLVHNTCISEREIEELAADNVYWCFCPSANLYIEGRLPDFRAFAPVKRNICFGTDSLASNTRLDLLAEAEVYSREAGQDEASIFKALTFNGARALNISNNFGKIKAGRNAGLNLVSSRDGRLSLLKKIF